MAGRIPASLRTGLGDDATFGLVELLNAERKDWSEQVLVTASDRFERRLTQEAALIRQEVQRSLDDGLGAIRADMANARVEMLRWSFVFLIGQVAAVAAVFAFILRATGR